MSSIDDRIVRMSFDNARFERGAAQTISTLDRLDEKLKFKSAKKGSQDLEKSFNSIDLSRMEKSIEAIEKRFTTLGVAGMNVINQITNGIIGSVKQLEAATIGQIKTGGWNRAMNIANAKFQIEGLGFEWGSIESAVSYGVKDTAYGLDAAASAASQLAASGVDFQNTLETVNGQDLTAMHKSLRAISGVAAMTNSSYEDIARIFTTVAGNGRLMGDQLLQLSTRGMNVAAKLAETLGTTEADIRDMVSRGKIDFQTFAFAMDDAFGEHAKEANKTFTGALGNMKAALSRIGEIFASPIINKTNTLFISITKRIDEIKNKLKRITVPKTIDDIKKEYKELAGNAAALNEVLKASDGKALEFAGHFSEMWQSGIDAFSTMTQSIDLGWFDDVVKKMDEATNELKFFFDNIREYFGGEEDAISDGMSEASSTLTVSAKEFEAAKAIIDRNAYGVGTARQKALAELFGGGAEGEKHAKNVQAYIDSVIAAGWSYEKAAIKVDKSSELIEGATGKFAKQSETIQKLKEQYADLPGYAYDAIETSMNGIDLPVEEVVEKSAKEIKKARLFRVLDNIKKSFSNISKAFSNVLDTARKIATAVTDAFSIAFKMEDKNLIEMLSEGLVYVTDKIVKVSEKLKISIATVTKLRNTFVKVFESIKPFKDIFANVVTIIKKSFTTAINIVKDFFRIFGINTDSIFNVVDLIVGGISEVVAKLADSEDATINIENVFIRIFEVVKSIVDFLESSVFSAKDLVVSFVESDTFENFKVNTTNVIKWIQSKGITWDTIYEGSKKLLGNVKDMLSNYNNIPEMIGDFLDGLYKMFEDVGVIDGTNIAMYAIAVNSITNLFLNLSDFGDLLGTIVGVPAKIGGMFGKIGGMFGEIGKAIPRLSYAQSLKILAQALAIIGGTIVALAMVPSSDMYRGLAAVITIAIIMRALSRTFISIGTAGMGIRAALNPLVRSITALISISGFMFAFAAVLIGIAVALAEINKTVGDGANMMIVLGVAIGVMVMVGSATLIIYKMSESAARGAVNAVPHLLALSAAMVSIGAAFLGVSTGLYLIGKIDKDKVGGVLLMFAGIFIGITTLTYLIAKIPVRTIWGVAAIMGAIGIAMLEMAAVMLVLSLIPDGKLIASMEAISTMLIGLIGMGIAVMVACTSLNGYSPKPGAILAAFGGIFAIMLVVTVLVGIMSTMKDPKEVAESVQKIMKSIYGLIFVMGLIPVLLLIIAGSLSGALTSGGSTTGARDTTKVMSSVCYMMKTMAISIIAVAAAVLIFAKAIETIANINDGFGKAVASLIIFVVAIVALAAAATWIPGFGDALTKVGEAILTAGLGAALFGAGIFLINYGLKLLAPWLFVIASGMEAIFATIARHPVIFALLTVGLIAIIAGITYAVYTAWSTIHPIITAIASHVKTGVTAVGTVLKSAGRGLDTWFKGLTNAGKIKVATIITVLCSALLKASPTVMRTVGQMIVKLLDYLGQIAGRIVEGLIVLIIRVLNGLADSIRKHATQIAAALNNVLLALLSLLLQVLGQIIADIVALGGGIWGTGPSKAVAGFFDYLTENVNNYADNLAKAADLSAEAVEEYDNTIEKMNNEQFGFFNSTGTNITGLQDKFSDMASTFVSGSGDIGTAFDNLGGKTDALTGKLGNMPGYAMNGLPAEALGKNDADSWMAGVEKGLRGQNGVAIPSADEYMSQNGMSPEDYLSAGEIDGIAYNEGVLDGMTDTDGYYEATDINLTDGTVQAIEDKEPEVVEAINKHINKPAQNEIRNGRDGYYNAGGFCMDGLVRGVNSRREEVVTTMTTIARDGKNAFETEMGIASPSKVFYKNGQYIITGLIKGVSENTSRATGTMSSLATSIMSAFSSPIDYVGKIASGELQFDPRIQPVVDISTVTASVRTIRDAFGEQGLSLNGYTGKLAADIGTLDRTNADVVSELRALRSDMADMTDEIANMQMVIDTGALVGSISGTMDKALGKRAIFKGRRN